MTELLIDTLVGMVFTALVVGAIYGLGFAIDARCHLITSAYPVERNVLVFFIGFFAILAFGAVVSVFASLGQVLRH